MSSTLREFRGAWASAHELPSMPPREGMPEQVATLSHWFVHAPAAHPLWPQYLFFCVHLRDVEGQSRPPFRRWPDASHELLLLALNPELGPWAPETFAEKMLAPRAVSAWLSPPNVVEQLRAATDPQAVELTVLLAHALVDGHVPIEPDDVRNGRARWREVIDSTMQHIRLGGHPCDN